MRWKALLLVCAGVVTGISCAGGRADPSRDDATPAELVVRRGEFRGRVVLTGDLQAARSEKITVPRVPSWRTTIRWMAEDGADVVAGAKVLELDGGAFAADIEKKRLSVVKGESEVEQREAEAAVLVAEKESQAEQRRLSVEKARIDAELPQELVSRQKYTENLLALMRAQAEHEKAVEELTAAREASAATVEQAMISLQKAKRDLRDVEEALDTMIVRAPRSGVLVVGEHIRERRKYMVGDSVWVGLGVMEIPDLASMMVKASLSDVDDGKIRVGMAAECTMDSYPDLRFSGTVTDIAAVASEEGGQSLRRSFAVSIALQQTDTARMRPGMSVKVGIETARLANVLLAPRSALDLASDPPRLVLLGGQAPVDAVRVGPCNAAECVIVEGAVEGTKLGMRR
ncbi:MAG: efflux RND transporter periplasmic adaptor subunit [Acidobacteria bacterium]|nr:efflux RND transporter periplasmic adaptor subunit [Acidobacteriota bacterium]